MIIVSFSLAAIYFFIFSNSGLLERIRLEKGKINIQKKIEALKTENARLQTSLQRYKKGKYPPGDIMNSGFREQGDKFFFLRGLDKKISVPATDEISTQGSPPLLSYFRAGWVLLSASILASIYLYAWKHKNIGISE